MDKEHHKKFEAEPEKLVAYRKKKQKKSRQSSESTSTSQSDNPLSLTPPLLPENTTKVKTTETEVHNNSDSSIISEHLSSNSDSIENDRSYQEIEISNIPSNFSLLLQDLPSDDNVEHISQELQPSPLNDSVKNSSSNNNNSSLTNMNVEVKSNVQSILDEILKSEQFKSESEKTLTKNNVSVSSNESSFNLFEGVDLNDSLINDHDTKLNRTDNRSANRSNNASLNSINLNVNLSNLDKSDGNIKVQQLEELLTTKDTTIAVLAAELESFRELTSSNQSTLSLNTSTTDYKLYHDEFQTRIIEFQNALSHRDSVIQQLTEALQQSVINREQLQEQSEYFSKEIVALQNQLSETSAIISQRKFDTFNVEIKQDSIKSIKDSSIQTDSLPSQICQSDNTQMQNASNKVVKDITEVDGNKSLEKLNDSINQDEKNEVESGKTLAICVAQGIAHDSINDKSVLNLEFYCSKLEETLSTPQINLMNDLKNCINSYVQYKTLECQSASQNEIKILEDKLKSEKVNHEVETAKLKETLENVKHESVNVAMLKQELETKHAKEVEELRTYFERKCADLEKHYSDEIFDQQSRKMSGSSSSSEISDFLFSGSHPIAGPGGDSVHVQVDLSKIDPAKRDFSSLNKKDLIKLKYDLSNMTKDLDKYNLKHLSKQDLKALKKELNQYDLRSLLKYDLSTIKSEMQNKYHAELEILREDYENRIDVLNVEHDNRMQSLERKYVDQIESLKYDLDEALRNVDVHVSNAVQEVASSGEYELAEVVQSYERRLQEQVTLAKVDIINALEYQIKMLVENTAEDAVWPSELLQLRNRFTEHYEKQISELEVHHQEEITRLKEEHRKILNGALERARRRSLKDNDSLDQSDLDVIKERDNLKKTTSILRQLIGELMKYFTECEEELNNTLVEELLKHGFDKSLTELEVEINLNESSNSTYTDSLTNKRRVHLTPRFEELMATIDSSVPSSLDSNISIELKNELGECLKQLRVDARAILALSVNFNKADKKIEPNNEDDEKPTNSDNPSLQDRITSLTRQLITESQIKKELASELTEAKNYVQNLEAERANLDSQVEQLVAKQKVLEQDLGKAREKIADLIESNRKEIVSEGYGENPKISTQSLGDRIATLVDLQERARSMVAECASNADHPLLQLVEELCREGDRITEEAKNDHEDLRQQIEAADKKLRATCHFLEEQAAEREQERDEAQREIAALREQLREREKDRASCERINKELLQEEELESLNVCCHNFKNTVAHTVEQLEQQMREMSKLIEENEFKHNEIEVEKKEAIEKIFVLRDIIRDLESQIEAKTGTEGELRILVSELEEIIKQQNKNNEELNQHLSTVKSISEAQHQERLEHLEEEVQRLRLNTEFAGSEGALKKIKTQLNEFEANIDKRTRDLEALHSTISATTCSSPSEDMSLRDQIRPRTPTALEECDVPLQQLARLKEKLIKHTRAEDAAVKRVHDLEMELVGIRRDLDEVQNERDMLQDQVSEQLVLISSLQMRLDDQRLRAEQVQKQTNTSLEMHIYGLQNEIKNLTEAISARDKTIKQLNKAVDETKKKLSDQEKELSEKQDDKILVELQREIQKLRSENTSLLTKINSDAQNAQVLPNLVDNILADKNKDIEMLREKLDKTQSELNAYLSLNFDHEQLKALSRLNSSERAFSDILSLINVESPEKMRMAEKINESLSDSLHGPTYKRNINETAFLGSTSKFEPELSSIEHVGQPPNIHYSLEAPLSKPNSTEIPRSSEKRVHFDESIFNITIEKLQSEILELKTEIYCRDQTIQEYTERLKILSELEVNFEKLQQKLDFTENALQKATVAFEQEQNDLKEIEKNLRIELAEKKMHLMDKEKQLELSEQDSVRKDQMYINLAKEKREIEMVLRELQDNAERYKNFDNILSEKNQEIQTLKGHLIEVTNVAEKVKHLEVELNLKQEELKSLQEAFSKLQEEANNKSSNLNEFKEKLSVCNNEIKEKDELNIKVTKDLRNKEAQLNSLAKEIETLKKAVEDKNKAIESFKVHKEKEEKISLSHMETKLKEMKDLLIDRETEIEILNEDITRYQEDVAQLEKKLKQSKNSLESKFEIQLAERMRDIAAKDLQIVKLTEKLGDVNREVLHLKDLLDKKEKIINQMSDDSKSLHANLETIQSKMQESGNVVDLKRRLEDEQQLNASLQDEINSLKSVTAVSNVTMNPTVDMTTSIDEITGAVQKQLDYSARLDSNILNALSVGDNEQINLLSEINDVDFLKEMLTKEKNLNREHIKIKESLQIKLEELEGKYQHEKENVSRLVVLLEDERKNSNTIQLEDANMLEQLRIRLEGALENETEFEKLLEVEKRTRQDLELQVANLKQKLANLSSGENSKTELTEYKSLPTLESQEVNRLRKELQFLQEENSKIRIDVKNLKRTRNEMEANLKYNKDMLEMKNHEVKKLERKIEEIREIENAVKDKWIICKVELDQRNREIENSRVLISEIEQEGRDMKKEINRLNEKLRKAIERESRFMEASNDSQMKQQVPDKVLNKMKELSGLLKEHIKDNKQMSETIEKLTDERKGLQDRVTELEELNNVKLPFDDPVGRANHLFARYLRSESYRKALIWQKRYLVALLATYQTYPLFSKEIPIPFVSEAVANRPVRSNGIKRFKAIAVGVIAMLRMQFLVQRWHSGKRGVGLHHRRQVPPHLSTRASNPVLYSAAHFQVGQPVSSQNFSFQNAPALSNLQKFHSLDLTNNPIPNSPQCCGQTTATTVTMTMSSDNNRRPTTPTGQVNLGPWSGVTPPSKEQPKKNKNLGNGERQRTVHLSEGYVPLQAPALLSQYTERYDQIQQRLGMASDKSA